MDTLGGCVVAEWNSNSHNDGGSGMNYPSSSSSSSSLQIIAQYAGPPTNCNDDNHHLAYGIDLINTYTSNPSSGLQNSSITSIPTSTSMDTISSYQTTATIASCSFYENIIHVWQFQIS